MDQDLKQYLDAKTSNLEKLIVDVKDSLEREMRTGFAEVKTRFDTQAARLERQGALIQTGSRWTVRMNEGNPHFTQYEIPPKDEKEDHG